MKRLLLIPISAITMVSVSHAQITKGSILLGGGIGVSTYKQSEGTNESKNAQTSIIPSAGLAVKENTVVGLSLQYAKSNYKNSSMSGSDYTSWYGAGVFLRKYIPVFKSLYLYGEPEVSYARATGKDYSGSKYADVTGWNAKASLSTGLSYALSKKFYLEAGLPRLVSLSYEKTKSTGDTYTSSNENVNFYSNLSSATPFSLGFRIVLPK